MLHGKTGTQSVKVMHGETATQWLAARVASEVVLHEAVGAGVDALAVELTVTSSGAEAAAHATRQALAQLHSPLIEAIHPPDEALQRPSRVRSLTQPRLLARLTCVLEMMQYPALLVTSPRWFLLRHGTHTQGARQ